MSPPPEGTCKVSQNVPSGLTVSIISYRWFETPWRSCNITVKDMWTDTSKGTPLPAFTLKLIEIHIFLLVKWCLNMSSAKSRPFCLGLNMLIEAFGAGGFRNIISSNITCVFIEIDLPNRYWDLGMGKWVHLTRIYEIIYNHPSLP